MKISDTMQMFFPVSTIRQIEPFAVFALLLMAATCLSAAPPTAKPASAYSQLWTDSPFTDKPPPPEVVESGALDDYALSSVSGVGGEWVVRLIEKKDRTNRLRISSNDTTGDFRIVDVKMGRSYRDTVVTLSYRGRTGKLQFSEDKLLAVSGSAPARQPQPQPQPVPAQAGGQQLPPGINPNAGTSGQKKERKPRVVLPK